MDIVRVSERKEWRDWLKKHYKTAGEVWLVAPKKHTGQQRLAYNDAVEEALCFGWIDSQAKTFDADHTAQRFSPRKNFKYYSQPNIERLHKMRDQGKLLPEIETQVADVLDKPFDFSPDIIQAIKSDKKAWENYQGFSQAYRRIRVAYIEAARDRPEEFQKRLRNFVQKCAEGKHIGYGGIEAYY